MNAQSLPLINFLRGWPALSLLPSSLVLSASHSALTDHASAALSYGPDEGYKPLRHSISEWLTHFYRPKAGPVTYDRISITGGASQNLACILQTFTDPVYTRNVWMVAPTYYLACRIIEDAGFAGRLKGVPEDAGGIDIEVLEKGLRESEEQAVKEGNLKPLFKPPRPWRKIYRQIIYCVPTFSNPSSRTMSLSHRESLVHLARKYDALIIADDIYDMLQWSPSPSPSASLPHPDRAHLPRIVDIDRYLPYQTPSPSSREFGNALSNSSFSKLLGPGVRTGFAECSTALLAYGVSQTGSSRSGGCPSQLAATFVHELLASGALQRHITGTLQPAYARRYRVLTAAVRTHLVPLGVRMAQEDREVVGGYFVWLAMPKEIEAVELARRTVEEENLTVAEGPLFRVWGDESLEGGSFRHDVRLCFAWVDEEQLVQGVERLARVLRRMLQRNAKSNDWTISRAR